MSRYVARNGRTVVLAHDQTKISDGFECLAVSRWVADLAGMIPDGVRILLTADRFYQHLRLVEHFQEKGWQDRVRLKGNLTLSHRGGELLVGDLPALGLTGIEDAELCGGSVATSIVVLHGDSTRSLLSHVLKLKIIALLLMKTAMPSISVLR